MVKVVGFQLVEQKTCIAIWSAGLGYALYRSYLASTRFCNAYPHACSLKPGWFLDLPVDRAFDWIMCLQIVRQATVWWCAHLIGAELIRKYCQQFLVPWYVCIGVLFTSYTYGISLALFLLAHPLVFFTLAQTKSKALIWIVSAAGFHKVTEFFVNLTMNLDARDWYTTGIIFGTTGWTHLRCLSYCLDRIAASEESQNNVDQSDPSSSLATLLRDVSHLMAYTFYLPIMNTGPVLLYQEFKIGLSKPYHPWSTSRLLSFSITLLRYLGWAVLADITKHYIRCNTLLKYSEALAGLDAWPLYGLFYYRILDFMLTYTVQYGLPAVVAREEQFAVTSAPICVAHVQMPTQQWRFFDRGLYVFIVKYVYVPCLGRRRDMASKLFGSMVTFLFIFVFHGTTMYVLIWTVLNFLAVTVESIAKAVGSTAAYRQWETKWMAPATARRVYMIIGLPLELTTMLANMYFLTMSVKIGNAFAARMVTLDWPVIAVLIVIVYCRSHTTSYFIKCGKT